MRVLFEQLGVSDIIDKSRNRMGVGVRGEQLTSGSRVVMPASVQWSLSSANEQASLLQQDTIVHSSSSVNCLPPRLFISSTTPTVFPFHLTTLQHTDLVRKPVLLSTCLLKRGSAYGSATFNISPDANTYPAMPDSIGIEMVGPKATPSCSCATNSLPQGLGRKRAQRSAQKTVRK
jgi:hypothetical protein